jgi:hypothetical protein
LEGIAWINPKWFSKYSLAINTGMVFSKQLNHHAQIDLALVFQRDALTFIGEDSWGIYNNLRSGRNNYFGLQAIYFGIR